MNHGNLRGKTNKKTCHISAQGIAGLIQISWGVWWLGGIFAPQISHQVEKRVEKPSTPWLIDPPLGKDVNKKKSHSKKKTSI